MSHAFHHDEDDVFSRQIAHVVGLPHRFDAISRAGGQIIAPQVAQQAILVDAIVGRVERVGVNIAIERRRIGRQIKRTVAIAIEVGCSHDDGMRRRAKHRFIGEYFVRARERSRPNAHKSKTKAHRHDDSALDQRRGNLLKRRRRGRLKDPPKQKRTRHRKRRNRDNRHDDDVAIPLKRLLDHAHDTADARRKVEKTERTAQNGANFMAHDEVGRNDNHPQCRTQPLRLRHIALEPPRHAAKRPRPDAAKRRTKQRQHGNKAHFLGQSRKFNRRQPPHAAKNGEPRLQANRFDDECKNPKNEKEFPHQLSIRAFKAHKGAYIGRNPTQCPC